MPQLPNDVAENVEQTESGNVMEEGIYETALLKVDTGTGDKGPYWTWVFKNPEDSPRYKGWQHWLTTSLSPESAWKLKEVFAAFGASPATDTDDLIGKRVRVQVGTYTVQKGVNAGELKNNVQKVLPLSSDASDVTAGGNASTTVKNF